MAQLKSRPAHGDDRAVDMKIRQHRQHRTPLGRDELGGARPQSETCSVAATMLAWVSTAPLGIPVVPPVNWIRAGSAGAMATLGIGYGWSSSIRRLKCCQPSSSSSSAAVLTKPSIKSVTRVTRLIQRDLPDQGANRRQHHVEGDQSDIPVSSTTRFSSCGVHRVEIDDHDPQTPAGIATDHILGAGGQEQADTIAL